MSLEFLHGVELGKDFGLRYLVLGDELENIKVECRKFRLVYMAAAAKSLAAQHKTYLAELEDILRDRHTLADKGWTLEQFLTSINNIFQNMKEVQSECVKLEAELLEKRLSRRKRKSKPAQVRRSTSDSSSPSGDTVD